MSNQATSEQPIPSFTIDLARPPRERYHEVVQVFGSRMRSLAGLFDNLLSVFIASKWLRSIVIGLSKVCLRRVCDEEENEEVRGISAASDVPLYLLVALNNLLDCLLGCTSGAVPVSLGKATRNTGGDGTDLAHTRLLHFRTLDWGMDELRDLLVVLNFVNSSSADPSRVIARSITYAGFVGSLTAVKSIGSIVRSFMLRPSQQIDEMKHNSDSPISRFAEQTMALPPIPSAPCYLILCDGREAALIVKDHSTGTVRSTRGFIAQTNHDPKDDESALHTHEISRQDRHEVITSSFGVEDWIEESIDRLHCLQKKWDRLVVRYQAKYSATKPSITERTLRKWISDYPTLNECSHFTTVLDPMTGKIRWLVRGQLEDSEN
ncbi:hypothetical protein FHL15_005000 [Xylaria flabelliformis]|uniref:ceramidase n=1 Tax=Xylaria flabelliformis TaxID=2512241 RepID=A0A553I214_9PEZI|nr:hypothetical protein FHL15_005000 [Xylaria flabelliformis]